MSDKSGPVVLVCPLNWGLGHASRCIPLIDKLLDWNCRVVIAAEGASLDLLKEEFGEKAGYLILPGFRIKYPSSEKMALKIIRQLPALLRSTWKEHRSLRKIINETGAGIVISDNRYGLWSSKATSIFITHQVFIQAPARLKLFEKLIYGVNSFFMKRYHYVWVPDFPGEENLSGMLSHRKNLPFLRFIGPLTRFSCNDQHVRNEISRRWWSDDFYLVILSGPEPQRSILEWELVEKFDEKGLPVVFVRGLIKGKEVKGTKNRLMINHAGCFEMRQLIAQSKAVISRPGYSTLCDLTVFGKKALFIPTPGQTEQEYLGLSLEKKGYTRCVTQGSIALEKNLREALNLSGMPVFENDQELLQQALEEAGIKPAFYQ